MIFATLSRQGINYDPVLKKDPDNFALLNDPSTLRSKENEHQGKGYEGGGGHASEDVPGQTAKMPQLWCYRTY